MDFAAKIMLFDSDLGFFGPGVRDLFLNIDSEHSVKGASEKMGIRMPLHLSMCLLSLSRYLS